MRDADVRAAVRKHLNALHEGDASTRIVEEMGVWSGTVRIDVAVINGELCGYELKSDRDTLARLPTQVAYYGRVFDRLTLVVGTKHVDRAAEIIPDWWGVTAAASTASGVELTSIRAAQTNPDIEPYLVAQLLWKDEALAVLEKYDLAKGWRSKPAKAIHQRMANELPFGALSAEVRYALKTRRAWLGKSIGHECDVSV